MNSIKKTIYVLNINNYAPDITKYTYPLFEHYANKIGAEFKEITKRKYPEWDMEYERLQLYEIAKEDKNDWTIMFDADVIVHPETIDFTSILHKDTVFHPGLDMSLIRFQPDVYMLRDGRFKAPGNWMAIASDWCLDLWHPVDPGITQRDIESRITVSNFELSGTAPVKARHLIGDYILGSNISRYGLKVITAPEIYEKHNIVGSNFFFHDNTSAYQDKVKNIEKILYEWQLHRMIPTLPRTSNIIISSQL